MIESLPRTRWRHSIAEADVYDVLQNDRRRRALLCLRERGGSLPLDELATAVAVLESGEQPPPTGHRESVYNSLHQTHLPKLDALEVATYDESRKVVSLTRNASELERYLRLRAVGGFSWGEFYQSFALCSLLAVLFATIDAPVLGAIGPLPVVTAALVGLALSVSYQLWTARWVYLRSFRA